MKIGLQVTRFDWPGSPQNIGPKLAEIGTAADQLGFASLWVMDHFFQIQGIGEFDAPMLEGYSALNFLAGVTKQIRLGTMVTGVNYRHPGVLLKTVTALDVLSGGRAYLGIGAGWYEREAKGLGLPFPPLKERFERLEETLKIVKQAWTDDASPFEGKHYQLAEVVNRPQPHSKPHPPILIGGGGETKTLRFVAQYADASNMFGHYGKEAIAQKLDVLKRHCDSVGRDFNEIEITILAFMQAGPNGILVDEALKACEMWASLGVDQVIFSTVPGVETITPLETIGRQIIPEVAGL